MTCPRCGHQNNEGDRFCANCGARLTPVVPPRSDAPGMEGSDTPEASVEPVGAPQPSRIPPPVTPSFASGPAREEVDEEWRMSSLGPPPAPRRRIWLWILLGIAGLILICCVSAIVFFGFTDTGQNMLDDVVSTAEAIQTEQAR